MMFSMKASKAFLSRLSLRFSSYSTATRASK